VLLHGVNPDGGINVNTLETDYRWYIQQGLMGDIVDIRNMVDNRFVDHALQQVGRYPR
jgi:hypothetical protein